MNTQEQIISITDKYLNLWVDLGGNKLPIRDIQPEMSDLAQDPKEEWRIWFPIKSQVTDSELSDLERAIGHSYAESYKIFLKHKHFYDLPIAEVSFCSHPVHVWRKSITEMIFEGYPKEYLIDRGLVSFATYSDWGMLCFDTSKRLNNGEYIIVLWDHEHPYKAEPLYQSFAEMLIAIDKKNEDFG